MILTCYDYKFLEMWFERNEIFHTSAPRDRLVNCAVEDGATPLFLAAQEGHTDCLRLLLQHGADANMMTLEPVALPLHAALQFARVQYVYLLILFGVGASSFQSPRSPILCFFYLYMFLLHVFSYNITPPQFRSSYLSLSTHFHLLFTDSVFLSTWPNHLRLASLIFSLMFSQPALALISSFLILSILFIPIIHLSAFSFLFFLANVALPFSMSSTYIYILGGCPFNGPLSGTKYPTRAASPIQNASTPKSSLPFSKHRSCALLCAGFSRTLHRVSYFVYF